MDLCISFNSSIINMNTSRFLHGENTCKIPFILSPTPWNNSHCKESINYLSLHPKAFNITMSRRYPIYDNSPSMSKIPPIFHSRELSILWKLCFVLFGHFVQHLYTVSLTINGYNDLCDPLQHASSNIFGIIRNTS